MEDLTFGEQVKIILGRKGMTIKQLAELIEVRTGKKMSRQNLTQRLGRDNLQEQDMRMIAEILECPFRLSILGGEAQSQVLPKSRPAGSRIQAAEPESTSDFVRKTEPVYMQEELQAEETGELQAEQREAEQQNAVTGESVPADVSEQSGGTEEVLEADERDMTIGELYDIHKE